MNKEQTKKTGPRIPRKITPQRLRNIALYYLERYSASSDSVRQVLRRRIFKASRHHEFDIEEAHGWVEEVIASFTELGYLDDKNYAETKIRSLISRGKSFRYAKGYLMQKGLDPELITQAIEPYLEDEEDHELESCRRLARKKSIGPFRDEEDRQEYFQKDLAKLIRAGFSYATAKQVMEMD